LGISIVEREFDVAREVDDRKILVYVLRTANRDERETIFLRKVGDFNSGYFHAQPFQTPQQLADHFKNDLAAWLSQRIVRSALPPAALFGSSDAISRKSSAPAISVALAAAIGVYEVTRAAGLLGSNFSSPSVASVLSAAQQAWPRLAIALLQFISYVVASGFLALTIATIVTAVVSRRKHAVGILNKLILIVAAVGTYLVLLGPLVLGFSGGVFIITAS
jgi:hypothetical protein